MSYTPLMLAAWWGRLDIVQYLVEKDANLRNCSTEGEHALQLAVRANKLDVSASLLTSEAALCPSLAA